MASAARTGTKKKMPARETTPLQGSPDTIDCCFFRSASASSSSYRSKYQSGKITKEVFTDGGCWANGRRDALAGYRLDFGFEDPRNICGVPVEGEQTNNRAHASGLLGAVKMTTEDVTIITVSAITVRV